MKDDTSYTIDATGRSLGRVAAEAAKVLMGKTRADFTPHKRISVRVCITNAKKISMSDRKRSQKTYKTYSGYPGGLREESYASLRARRGGGEPLRRAIARMIPRNTFHTARMKNLEITD